MPVSAQADENITSFQQSVQLTTSSAATITETITYDFGENQRRGIFREIPIRYYQAANEGFELSIDIISVERNGRPEQYSVRQNNSDFLSLRIGDPDTSIRGEHVYAITYATSELAVASEDGHEIVRLDAPGTGWSVPTLTAISDISSPISPVTSTCYQGFIGEGEQHCTLLSDRTGFSSSRQLREGETITVEYAYQAGTFTKTADLVSLSRESGVSAGLVIGLLMLGAGLLIGVYNLIMRWRHRQRKDKEVPYPRYQPPPDMSPAQIGLLVDNSSAGAELSATIIDLAVRGYIKIQLETSKKWYRRAVYSFSMQQSAAGLNQYEKELFDAFFADGRTHISTKDLTKDKKFLAANRKFHTDLGESLVQLGFYKQANFFKALAGRMSDTGYAKWAEVEGFKRFLELTEADRMAMLEAPERKPEEFSDFLPYAVALGVEKQWAEQFASLHVDVSRWYEAPAMESYLLASGIGDLSSGLHQVSHAANNSAGGSGVSGGFSGGGFGGGGGGSW